MTADGHPAALNRAAYAAAAVAPLNGFDATHRPDPVIADCTTSLVRAGPWDRIGGIA